MNFLHPWSTRRLIAVDVGSRCVKLLLAESNGPTVSVLDCKLVDLPEEGLLAPDEIRSHLAGIIQTWGKWPLAVALPVQVSFSQVVDLLGAGEAGIPRVIEEQTSRLRGLSNSSLVYDAVRLDPDGQWQQPYFITIAREEDVDQHLKRVTAEDQNVHAVCGIANALLRACATLQPPFNRGVLVDFGASVTTVVVVHNGQGVFASSYAFGSVTLAEALAKARDCSEPKAGALLRAGDCFDGFSREPAVSEALDRWFAQLRSLLDEWRLQNSEWFPAGQPVPVRISGGALEMPGLQDRLQTEPGYIFTRWPDLPRGRQVQSGPDFVVAYGTASEAFRRPADKSSLLPPRLRAHWKALRQAVTASTACAVFLVFIALLLSFATWQKLSLLKHKRNLVQEAETALAHVEQFEKLTRDRDRAFEQFSPLLDLQERTYGLLHTLRVLQHARAQNDFWCVLLADSDSYARGTTLPLWGTNQMFLTNTLAAAEEYPAKLTFIVELCVPAGGDQTAKTLSDVVVGLRKNPLFGRVDSLPAAQRRALVDAKVLIPDRHFALSMDLADLGWRSLFQTVRWAESRAGSGTNNLRRPGSSLTTRPRRAPVPSTSTPAATDQIP